MRTLIVFVLYLTVLSPGFCQTDAKVPTSFPKEPKEVLAAAAPSYDFTSPNLKPWHLKATYQLYDLKGNPSEQGSWEYWWASPKMRRATWTGAGFERTEWSTADGAVYHRESGRSLRYFERSIVDMFLSPLPHGENLYHGKLKVDLKMIPPQKPELECVISTLQPSADGMPQVPDSTVVSYYCFDPPTLALRIAYDGPVTKEFVHIVKSQGLYLPRQVEVTIGKQKCLTVSVDTIDTISPASSLFNPAEDAKLEKDVSPSDEDVQHRITYGKLVKKTQPIYPPASKMAHEQGVVVLDAAIGTDGKVHDLEVLSSPSPLLAESAVDAVKHWEYTPVLLNGVPIEVETRVNVIFTLDN